MSAIRGTATGPVAVLVLALSVLIGGGGLAAFMYSLFAGPPGLLNLQLGEVQSLLFNTLLCLLFFVQHSIMARNWFHRWIGEKLPRQYDGPLYVIASGIAVVVLLVFWQESSQLLITFQGPARWVLRGVYWIAFTCVGYTLLSLGLLVNFRLQPIVDDVRGSEIRPWPLVRRGPYRWVRHPLYLCSLLMFWSYPDVTLDRLLLNFVFTLWVIVAIQLEERDLVSDFGDAYRNFQREVPMLIPWRVPMFSEARRTSG